MLSKEMILSLLVSLFTRVLFLFVGWLGLQYGADEIGKVATGLAVAAMFGLSMLWSVRDKLIWWNKPKANAPTIPAAMLPPVPKP